MTMAQALNIASLNRSALEAKIVGSFSVLFDMDGNNTYLMLQAFLGMKDMDDDCSQYIDWC